jgi:hypothetical protein
MKRCIQVTLMAFLLMCASNTQATLIQYEFSGTVQTIYDDAQQLAGVVQLGAPYTATWVFDTNAPDSDPLAMWGEYEAVSASLVMPGIQVGKGGSLEVLNGTSGDWLDFNTPNPGIRFTAHLAEHTGTALPSDAMPTQIPSFPDRFLGVFWVSAASKFFASIDSTTVSIVPEPGALRLAVLGMVCLWPLCTRSIPTSFRRSYASQAGQQR